MAGIWPEAMGSAIQVAPNGRSLLRDGQPFFWLADTCWSAFTNIPEEEWTRYLDLRREQGINVLQINTLPQWDRCGTTLQYHPFPTKDGMRYDFSAICPEYFDRARKMCQAAVDRGFVLALVVMWCNYVPDTWAARIFPDNVIPEDRVEPIVRTICENFNEFSPVYIVSGDTGFESEVTTERYRLITDLVDQYAPGFLKAFHIKGRYDGLPQDLGERADLYFYQSGHNAGAQDTARTLAEHFYGRAPVRPVINSEPCYEQMGYSHKAYGRFRRADIRRALWNSLLSGAGAGITYGAHGVWNWQKPGMPKNPIAGEGFLQALPVDAALRFPGIADYAFAKDFFLDRGIGCPTPCQEVVAQYADHIRAARTADGRLLVYLPTNAAFSLRGDHGGESEVIHLDTGETETVEALFTGEETAIPMHGGLADALVVLK